MAISFPRLSGLPPRGHALGILHDRGRERDAFQQYTRTTSGLPVTDEESYGEHHRVFVGGVLVTSLTGKSVFSLFANQIIFHHAGLHDHVDAKNAIERRQLPGEINKGNITLSISQLREGLLESPFPKLKVDMKHFHHLSRILPFCLMDADGLNTEQFMGIKSWGKRGYSSTLTDLLPKSEAHLRELRLYAPNTEVSHTRGKVRERCRKISSERKGPYGLTVPTEGDKTLSSLSWAMKHAVNHGMNRITVAIPYTSTIVQTAGLLREIFDEERVLEHHNNLDPDKMKNEEIHEKVKLATKNWNHPIIVAINVQLFESVFGNKPFDCHKLHNTVNSVPILDGTQTLPTDFLQPIVDAFRAYQKIFEVLILFTTTSQPMLSGLIEEANPKASSEEMGRIIEIIPNEFVLHDKLRHMRLVIDNTGRTCDGIATEVATHNRVPCIINIRKDARELYDRLPNKGIKLHPSRTMCPAHISETIRKIKALLEGKPHPTIRVIATRLVEARVGIDFPVVFRQGLGLDPIL